MLIHFRILHFITSCLSPAQTLYGKQANSKTKIYGMVSQGFEINRYSFLNKTLQFTYRGVFLTYIFLQSF